MPLPICPQQVRGRGPWVHHSTFVFEGMLAHLKRMFHCSRAIPDQICRRVGAAQHASQWIWRDVLGNKTATEFTTRLMVASKSSQYLSLDDGVFSPSIQARNSTHWCSI